MVARAKGVGYGTVSLFTHRVIQALFNLAPKYVRWPDSTERRQLQTRTYQKFGLPGCIGVSTDGTHIPLSQRPSLDGEVYFSRKKEYSFNAILTIDMDRNVRHAIVGWPGSVHDTTPWERCDIHRTPDRFFDPGQYQTLDSAFELNLNAMIPFRNPAAQQPENKAFNEVLCGQRVVSEHGNGIIKGRWGSLKELPIQIKSPSDVQRSCKWIVACLVLHNMVNMINNPADEVPPALDCTAASILEALARYDREVHASRTAQEEAIRWREQIQRHVLLNLGWIDE